MLDLPKNAIDSIKRVLMKQQKEVEENLKEVELDDPANSNDVVESSEPGTDSYIADTHTKTLVVEEELKKTDNSIKKALSKIRVGSYGKCEKCGKGIGIKRLFAIPTASLCLDCSAKVQKRS